MTESELWKPQPYAEIFIDDDYHLRQLDFTPDVVLDIGGNVGCFTGFAKTLWPDCRVIAVEPNDENANVFRATTAGVEGITLLHAALGRGQLKYHLGPNAGSHTYTTPSIGFSEAALATRQDFSTADLPTVMLDDVLAKAGAHGEYIVKIDCEGAEQVLFTHEPSLEVLRNAAFFTAELHFYAAKWETTPTAERCCARMLQSHGSVINAYWQWAYSFTDTHDVVLSLRPAGGMLWAKRLVPAIVQNRDGGRSNVLLQHSVMGGTAQ